MLCVVQVRGWLGHVKISHRSQEGGYDDEVSIKCQVQRDLIQAVFT